MRFKEFIIESESTAEDVAEMVLADYQPYLKEKFTNEIQAVYSSRRFYS